MVHRCPFNRPGNRKSCLLVIGSIMRQCCTTRSTWGRSAATAFAAFWTGVVPNAGCILRGLGGLVGTGGRHGDGCIRRSWFRRSARLRMESLVVHIGRAAGRAVGLSGATATRAVFRADVVLYATSSRSAGSSQLWKSCRCSSSGGICSQVRCHFRGRCRSLRSRFVALACKSKCGNGQ